MLSALGGLQLGEKAGNWRIIQTITTMRETKNENYIRQYGQGRLLSGSDSEAERDQQAQIPRGICVVSGLAAAQCLKQREEVPKESKRRGGDEGESPFLWY